MLRMKNERLITIHNSSNINQTRGTAVFDEMMQLLLLAVTAACLPHGANSFSPPRSRSLLPLFFSSSLNQEQPKNTHVVSSSLQKIGVDNVNSSTGDQDTLLKFSRDIKKVLHELRGSTIDPTIPQYLIQTSSQLSYSKTWTLTDWEKQYSRKRYLRYILFFPKSRLLRRIAPQQTALFIWTLASIWIEDHLFIKSKVSVAALSTISTFLAFLLTLRSNQSLSRLDEGRKLWSKTVLKTREMSQLISAFIYPVDKQLALMLARHVSIFGWLLKSELRLSTKESVADIVRTILPNQFDAEYVLSQRQKANAVVSRIRQVIHHLAKDHRLSTAEEIALDHTAQSLSEIITASGRIRASPIPTLYTSHASRLLVFYLVCLPPALYCSGLDRITTTIITMVVGYAMIGLDELSHLCKDLKLFSVYSNLETHL